MFDRWIEINVTRYFSVLFSSNLVHHLLVAMVSVVGIFVFIHPPANPKKKLPNRI